MFFDYRSPSRLKTPVSVVCPHTLPEPWLDAGGEVDNDDQTRICPQET